MIASILSFCLKSSLCSGVFAAYYLLALKNAQINRFNRVYLLSAVFLSLVLPFSHFELFSISQVAVPDFPILRISGTGADEVSVHSPAAQTFDWQLIFAAAYLSVSAAIVLILAAKTISVYRLQRQGQKIKEDGYLLVKTDDPRAPFSFMHLLFWPVHMRQDGPEAKGILLHELAHIRQRHTFDKVLMQLMLAACWLNPFNWLLKKELWLQHEFLADRCAVKDGDSETFARMLLYTVSNTFNRSIISPFFQSPVKRRLSMLTQTGKNTFGLMRRFMAIPVLLVAVFLLSTKTKSPKASRAAKPIVLVLDAGHGGKDNGARSIDGQLEKDMTLAICKKLVALSDEYNIKVISTRTEDSYPTLEERVRISNSADDAIFLSIHLNKSTEKDPRDNSYELGVNKNNKNYDKSILLASSIANKLKTQQVPVKLVDHSMIRVVRENKHPALLIECGNIDDADNIAMLKDEGRSEALCREILSGIVDYSAKAGTR